MQQPHKFRFKYITSKKNQGPRKHTIWSGSFFIYNIVWDSNSNYKSGASSVTHRNISNKDLEQAPSSQNFPKANTQPQLRVLAPLCTFLLRIRVEGLVNFVTTGPGKIINELTGKTFADPAHTVESFPKKLFK